MMTASNGASRHGEAIEAANLEDVKRKAKARPLEYSDLAAAYRSLSAERNWTVEGAWEASPVIPLVGPEKAGKSWIAADLAVCTITGKSWLGAFPVRRTGNVVVVENEYGQSEYVRRLARIARARGIEPEDILARDDRGVLVVRHYEVSDLMLNKDNDALKRLRWDVEANPPALIIIDPLRNYIDGNENETTDMVETLRLAKYLRDHSGATVVLVHHVNKEGKQSGNRAIRTMADVLLDGTDEDVPLYSARGRTLRTTDRIRTPFRVEIEHTDDDDDTIATTTLRAVFEGEKKKHDGISDNAQKLLNALKALAKHRGTGNAIGIKAGVTSGKQRAKGLNELAAKSLIVKTDDGEWKLSPKERIELQRDLSNAEAAAEYDAAGQDADVPF